MWGTLSGSSYYPNYIENFKLDPATSSSAPYICSNISDVTGLVIYQYCSTLVNIIITQYVKFMSKMLQIFCSKLTIGRYSRLNS